MKDIIYRKFLNSKGYHSTAAILASVEFDEGENYKSAWSTLSISDCSRKVSIDLSADNKTELKNTLEKLRILREGIEFLEREIPKAYEWQKTKEK